VIDGRQMNNVQESEGQGWIPYVKLRVMRWVANGYQKGANGSGHATTTVMMAQENLFGRYIEGLEVLII
jgi:hypothetical protein